MLVYKVVKKEDVSYLNTPRMVYKIVLDVEKIPSNEQLKETGIHIWKDGNTLWKEFTVFIYLPEMDIKNVAFVMMEFGPNGLREFKVQDFALMETKWWREVNER